MLGEEYSNETRFANSIASTFVHWFAKTESLMPRLDPASPIFRDTEIRSMS